MYIFKLFNELNIWRKVRAIALENEQALNESGFRVDWIGRIYTVINLPEEVINQPISREGYVLMKLREYDSLFLNMGIADAIAPELMEIEGAEAYLLVLSPDRDYLKFWPFTVSMIKTAGLFFALRLVYLLITHYWSSISSAWNWIF
jgi:hypothetical protein